MNQINVSGLICKDIERREGVNSSADIIGMTNKIQLDSDSKGKFKIVLFLNGVINDEEIEVTPYIINTNFKQKLKLDSRKIMNENREKKFLDVKAIYDIDTVFPAEGSYSILVKIQKD